ncbi:GtrA family protein [Helicobacter muridarum]|uniref:GtrA family protein n=1 Tax=Helicobacter muridarum TaxID=216 RepID=A0A377PYY8_9HELI|nr:GtrA family protein [Helicobacter muridarum]TLD98504.1 GtrA family protein [Helicobacter muridarum]STQ86803.1 putative GtrA family protein [Helicobacter muridarum]
MNQYMNIFFKYLLVGGSAALINWLIFFLCFYYFDIYYLLAGAISFIVATLWNFLLAKKFIFHSSTYSPLKEGALIYLVSFGGLIIDMSVLYLCVQWLGLHEIVGKILATGIAFVFNFGMRQFIIYR